MKSFIEILAAVYAPVFWLVTDEWGDFCVFCGASDGKDQGKPGEIHHYGSCLLREIRAHLMRQIAMPRRFREAAIEQLGMPPSWDHEMEIDFSVECDGRGKTTCPEKSPLVEEIERIVDEVFAPEPKASKPIYLGNNASGSTVVLPSESVKVVSEAEVYRTARAEPAVVPVVEPERLHSWQSMTNGKAARCANCGLVALNGAPALNDVCPGRNPDLPAPAVVKAVAPAVPLVKIMCPRCHAAETALASGGALPDLPQITPDGPFMVVGWAHPAHGQQVGVYCKACWVSTVNALVTGILPCAVVIPPTQGPGQPA